MAPLRILLPVLALTIASASAWNLTRYVPDCAQPCIESSIKACSNCTGPLDSQCLCTEIQSIGPGALPCAQGACRGGSTRGLAIELRSTYRQFCDDAGVEALDDGPLPNGFIPPDIPSGTTETSSSTTSPAAAATGTTDTPASHRPHNVASTGSGSGGSNDLSRGAIAGIAVGVGVACILITGGLFLMAFRLGKARRAQEGKDGLGPSPNSNSGSGSGGQQEEGVRGTPDVNGASSGSGTIIGDKTPQLEGAPVSELQTEYTLSGFDPVKELATHEKPVELSAESPQRYRGDGSPVLPSGWT